MPERGRPGAARSTPGRPTTGRPTKPTKAVILAGGLGTRLSEETALRPKPMVEIGSMPILWHIMQIYWAHGIDDFVVLCGYKGHMIKAFFRDYAMRRSTVRFDIQAGTETLLDDRAEPWRVTLVDTGELTMTGGRLRRAREHLGDAPFHLTYGDGVGDVDLGALEEAHLADDALVTITAVQPPGRFGVLSLEPDRNRIDAFREKPEGEGAWVNGGFFVVDPRAVDYVDGDETVWEQEPLERVAREGRLVAHRHRGFWHPMDTLRDRNYLESLWNAGEAPWKRW